MTSILEEGRLRDKLPEQQSEGHNLTVSDTTISRNKVAPSCRDRRLIDMVRESSPDKYDSDESMELRKEFWSKEKAVAAL